MTALGTLVGYCGEEARSLSRVDQMEAVRSTVMCLGPQAMVHFPMKRSDGKLIKAYSVHSHATGTKDPSVMSIGSATMHLGSRTIAGSLASRLPH